MSGRAARAAKTRKRLRREQLKRELYAVLMKGIIKAASTPLIPEDSPLLQLARQYSHVTQGRAAIFDVVLRPEP
jgi:hypothetical protein